MYRVCEHFGICGGCSYQHIPYPSQLEIKTEFLRNLFGSYNLPRCEVTGSPEIWHYRNKIDPGFSREYFPTPPVKGVHRKTILGFKKRGRWFEPFPLHECLIGPEQLPSLLGAILHWCEVCGYEAYDRRTQEGVLHALLLRRGKRTGETLLAIITRDWDLHWECLLELLQYSYPCVSIYAGLYRGTSEVSQAQEWRLIAGQPRFTEEIILNIHPTQRKTYSISPGSFFQSNTLCAEQMFQQIYQWVRSIQPKVIYDLYGGIGTISIGVSNLAEMVYCVDCVESAIQDGIENSKMNRTENVTFCLSTVRNFLKMGLQQKNNWNLYSDSVVILDPPREGLTKKVIERLLQWLPKHLIYISCNPKVLSNELRTLLEQYRCVEMRAFDFFPHTEHVEICIWLTRY